MFPDSEVQLRTAHEGCDTMEFVLFDAHDHSVSSIEGIPVQHRSSTAREFMDESCCVVTKLFLKKKHSFQNSPPQKKNTCKKKTRAFNREKKTKEIYIYIF